MESKDTFSNNSDDTLIDEVDEYPRLFSYLKNCGFITENELIFNGDIELAKQYEAHEAASALLDLYNTGESNIQLNGEILTGDCTQMCVENVTTNHETKDNNSFLLPRYSPPKLQISSFQLPHEPRAKYLLRSIKLWQEFRNTGDMEKLKILFEDILTDQCLSFLHSSLQPIFGRQKIYEQNVSYNQNIPDLCVFHNNIVRTKRRVIVFKGNSFGSFPYANASDKSTATWNIFEFAPIDKLDEHHKLQKQKYDTLKSQNKVIKFERRCVWYVMLTRDLKYISKIMATDAKVDIY